MKIQLFEYGTLFIDQKKKYRLEIPVNKILAEGPEELKELQEESVYFFPLKEIKKENDRLLLEYETVENYQPLFAAKKYSKVLRLSLLNELLVLDPLHTLKEKVLIHPRNIFFKDMKKLKFLYRSNQWLPYDNHIEKLEQYKILIISMLSRFSYEKYKREKDHLLKKEKDEFLFQIANAGSVEDLKELISTKLQKEESQHFLEYELKRKRMKKQKSIFAGISISTCVVSFTVFLFLHQSSIHKVQKAYTMELQKSEQKSEFYKLMGEKKYNDAISLLEKNGGSKKEIAYVYFKKEDYQQAITNDPSLIKPVVEALYKENKQDDILGLGAKSDYLDIEKKIIRYDYNILLSMQAFVKDEGQKFRIGKAFLEHGDLVDAKSLNQTLQSKELDVMIRKTELENQIATLEKQIKDMKDSKEKPEDKQKELNSKNKALERAKTEIEKMNNEMG